MAAYGANAGAAIGTAIAPGVGTALGGLFGSFLDSPGAAASGGGPVSSSAAVYGSGLDASNWNVNFSGTQSASSGSGGMPVSGGGAAIGLGGIGGFSVGAVPSWFWIAAGAVVVWKLTRSRSKK